MFITSEVFLLIDYPMYHAYRLLINAKNRQVTAHRHWIARSYADLGLNWNELMMRSGRSSKQF